MKQRIIGIALAIIGFVLYFFDVLNFQGSDFLLGLISAIGIGLLFGLFLKKKA